jgi:hypothetical protein
LISLRCLVWRETRVGVNIQTLFHVISSWRRVHLPQSSLNWCEGHSEAFMRVIAWTTVRQRTQAVG